MCGCSRCVVQCLSFRLHNSCMCLSLSVLYLCVCPVVVKSICVIPNATVFFALYLQSNLYSMMMTVLRVFAVRLQNMYNIMHCMHIYAYVNLRNPSPYSQQQQQQISQHVSLLCCSFIHTSNIYIHINTHCPSSRTSARCTWRLSLPNRPTVNHISLASA